MKSNNEVTDSDKSVASGTPETIEDETAKKEEKKKKARLRRRGPYRKAHVDW